MGNLRLATSKPTRALQITIMLHNERNKSFECSAATTIADWIQELPKHTTIIHIIHIVNNTWRTEW